MTFEDDEIASLQKRATAWTRQGTELNRSKRLPESDLEEGRDVRDEVAMNGHLRAMNHQNGWQQGDFLRRNRTRDRPWRMHGGRNLLWRHRSDHGHGIARPYCADGFP